MRGFQGNENFIKYQWGIDLTYFLPIGITFQFPSQMFHVNILAYTILKFINELSYGTDPVHLSSTKFKALVLSLENCHK